MLAKVLERDIERIADVLMDIARYAYSARFSESLHARGYVHAIAEKIIAIDHYIAQANTNAEQNFAVLGFTFVEPRYGPLDINSASNRINGALEFDQQAVAGRLENASAVFRDLGIDQIVAQGLHANKRTFLVGLHHPTVADDVSSQYRC